MRRIIILLVILGLLFCYFNFTGPGEIVINESGTVKGLINKGRSALQGERFWKSQLKIATAIYDSSRLPHPPSSTELKDMYQRMREDQRALDSRMSSLYTRDEQMANALRIKADSIERASRWNTLDEEDYKARIKSAESIEKKVKAIESRLHIDKSQSVIK